MRIQIGIGRLRVVESKAVLVGTALGSCVGLMLFAESSPVAGLAHIMLPSSDHGSMDGLPAKFADTAVSRMLDRFEQQGVDIRDCRAKLAGGATMFSGLTGGSSEVGLRNVAAVRKRLAEYNIPVVAADTGGGHARTVEFDTVSHMAVIKSVLFGEKLI